MKTITLKFPNQVTFGDGCINNFIGDYSRKKLNKLFIVTFPEMLPALDESLHKLRTLGIEVFIDTSITAEPTYGSFNIVLNHAKDVKADSVVGIGGGSSLDVAKLVAAQLNNDQSIEDIIGIGNLKQRTIYLACLPTTSGTGSEVSPNAILLDEKENLKKGVVSPFLIPDAAYIDPVLTHSVPPKVTAATGMDALIHCIEEFTNVNSHPLVDIYALEGIRLIGANLVKAFHDGEDAEAREKVALGSLFGGLGLGSVNTAAVHALSYPLGGEFHIPHGLSNAVLLPYVMRYNMIAVPDKYAKVAIALGVEKQASDLETAEKGVEKIFELCESLGIPTKISELNIPKDAVDRMTDSAVKVTRLLVNNPRSLSKEDIRTIYLEAF
ncbi:Alcohol dehydrogenase [hydrothermal vent metagenome]|uniref:Alcohol dehydrogenase n=1 Tax=hydrothermal vent metagenome TaxID=652676 RepID=A0A3B1CQ28_9ZZZZ